MRRFEVPPAPEMLKGTLASLVDSAYALQSLLFERTAPSRNEKRVLEIASLPLR